MLLVENYVGLLFTSRCFCILGQNIFILALEEKSYVDFNRIKDISVLWSCDCCPLLQIHKISRCYLMACQSLFKLLLWLIRHLQQNLLHLVFWLYLDDKKIDTLEDIWLIRWKVTDIHVLYASVAVPLAPVWIPTNINFPRVPCQPYLMMINLMMQWKRRLWTDRAVTRSTHKPFLVFLRDDLTK
jgi:hypothetical protein